LLLKKAQLGAITQQRAINIILAARRRAEMVRELLRALGDTEETLALALRFRRMAKRLESSKVDPKRAELHAELTQAFHQLNLTLSKDFYPAPSEA
jgi:hypothetical protein